MFTCIHSKIQADGLLLGMNGSSAGDHQSWMFHSFNPSTSPGGRAMAGISPCLPLLCYVPTTHASSLATARSCSSLPPLPVPRRLSDTLSLCIRCLKVGEQLRTRQSPYTPLQRGTCWLSSRPLHTRSSLHTLLPWYSELHQQDGLAWYWPHDLVWQERFHNLTRKFLLSPQVDPHGPFTAEWDISHYNERKTKNKLACPKKKKTVLLKGIGSQEKGHVHR